MMVLTAHTDMRHRAVALIAIAFGRLQKVWGAVLKRFDIQWGCFSPNI
jgi:hypothetical protein